MRYFVLFRSSFAYENAPNISHELPSADAERTYCGRSGWETYEPENRDHAEADCNTCRRNREKRLAKESTQS